MMKSNKNQQTLLGRNIHFLLIPRFDQLHRLVVEVKCFSRVFEEAEHHIQGGIVRVNLVTSCVYVDSAMIRNQIWEHLFSPLSKIDG